MKELLRKVTLLGFVPSLFFTLSSPALAGGKHHQPHHGTNVQQGQESQNHNHNNANGYGGQAHQDQNQGQKQDQNQTANGGSNHVGNGHGNFSPKAGANSENHIQNHNQSQGGNVHGSGNSHLENNVHNGASSSSGVDNSGSGNSTNTLNNGANSTSGSQSVIKDSGNGYSNSTSSNSNQNGASSTTGDQNTSVDASSNSSNTNNNQTGAQNTVIDASDNSTYKSDGRSLNINSGVQGTPGSVGFQTYNECGQLEFSQHVSPKRKNFSLGFSLFGSASAGIGYGADHDGNERSALIREQMVVLSAKTIQIASRASSPQMARFSIQHSVANVYRSQGANFKEAQAYAQEWTDKFLAQFQSQSDWNEFRAMNLKFKQQYCGDAPQEKVIIKEVIVEKEVPTTSTPTKGQTTSHHNIPQTGNKPPARF